MLVIKLVFLVIFAAAVSALDCYYCKSEDHGDKCINDTSQWTVMTCQPHEIACYIRLRREKEYDLDGFAERGCALNLNFCKDLLGQLGARRQLQYYESCGVCNRAKCNIINALEINSSGRNTMNILSLLLPFLLIATKI